MTARQIRRCLRSGQLVVVQGEPWLCFAPDLFGGLVVIAWRRHEDTGPARLASISDKRRAVMFDASMLKRKRRTLKQRTT